jgi:hypothetical protein
MAFIFGVIAGIVSGFVTYNSTAQTGLAVGTGVIVFLVGWILGIFFFGDASDIDLF